MLDAAIRQSIDESVLCWLATASAEGEPNVSPKEMFVSVGDDTLLIANIASPKSVSNIKLNPSVCVSFVDVFKQKGFKLRGVARIVEDSETRFEPLLCEIHKLGGENLPIRSIIEVSVDETDEILAPSYWLYPHTTEQSQIQQAMESYHVRPK
jgi:predicted pyridoxine 5'-phosphate oxidase superfamily flavin-nucleotide-binding protein